MTDLFQFVDEDSLWSGQFTQNILPPSQWYKVIFVAQLPGCYGSGTLSQSEAKHFINIHIHSDHHSFMNLHFFVIKWILSDSQWCYTWEQYGQPLDQHGNWTQPHWSHYQYLPCYLPWYTDQPTYTPDTRSVQSFSAAKAAQGMQMSVSPSFIQSVNNAYLFVRFTSKFCNSKSNET